MTFVSELSAALDTPSRRGTASRVHDLVANALRRLEPRAEIKHTDYFTHSFVPDLVVRWGPANDRQERHVYLRYSVTRPSFGSDLDDLGSDSPLFLGMTDTNGLAHPEWEAKSDALERTLVTQSAAIDEFESALRRDARTRTATGPIVRAGHGLIDEARAEGLSESYVAAVGSTAVAGTETEAAREAVATALSALREVLHEMEQLTVERTLQSEWIRHGGDPYDFPSVSPWNAELLDIETLRNVLNSLLDSGEPVAPETWQRNGGFIRAEDLGRILGRQLRGGSFNAMAHALLANWTAKWVWAQRTESPSLFPGYDWIVDGGILGIETSDLRTFFADDGRHFKDKEPGNLLPLLRDTREMLSHKGVQQVGLRSPREGIRYEPLATSGPVFDRLQSILSDPNSGQYSVVSLLAQIPGTDVVADIDLDRLVIDLKGRSAPVAALARLAARVFSRDSGQDALDHFLATGEALPEAQGSAA